MSAAHLSPTANFVDNKEMTRLQSRARYLRWRQRILPVIAFLALLVLWEATVVMLHVKAYIAPAPSVVLKTLYENYPMLLHNLVPTVVESLSGFMLGNLAAAAVAVFFVYNKAVEEALFPIAVMINTIPVVAKAPILVLLLGTGFAPKIVIAGMICFFPMLVNMVRGLRDVNAQQLELMHVISASQLEIFTKLRFRNSLPYLFSALRITAPVSVIGAIIAEWIGSDLGIGALIIQSTYEFNSPLLYATIIVASTFSATFFGIIVWLEHRAIHWNSTA
ncbi:ABC transporter permease [Mesorhizobium koreense]|uniref:ABC transporter permease n=1 Tax=Mesorhizobium koreense TaxID=3074855 RepID=UPI00287B9802|nr:ABC transporter permease [Mesorhizobium sp. WR6]